MIQKDLIKEIDDETRKNQTIQEFSLCNSIANLIGPEHLSNFLLYENDEVNVFRRSSVK